MARQIETVLVTVFNAEDRVVALFQYPGRGTKVQNHKINIRTGQKFTCEEERVKAVSRSTKMGTQKQIILIGLLGFKI